MVILHVVFGRPLLRFPVGVYLRATFGIESCGIRRTRPNHVMLGVYFPWVLTVVNILKYSLGVYW